MTTLVETFFAHLQAGDLAGALDLVAPDAEFVAARPGDPSDPDVMYGTYRGHDGVRDFIAKLGRVFEPELFAVERVATGPDVEFAAGNLRHRVRRTGRPFASAWAVMCVLKEGRIHRYHFFEDTAALEAAMEGAG